MINLIVHPSPCLMVRAPTLQVLDAVVRADALLRAQPD